MGSKSVFLNTNIFRPTSIMKPYLYTSNPIKRYTKMNVDGGEKERAPSLAEEFKRVEEEKAEAHPDIKHVAEEQGLASQTVDNATDAAEAASSDGDVNSVKEKFKEHQPGADYRRK